MTDYLKLLNETVESLDTEIDVAVASGIDGDPEEYSRAHKLSKASGMPVGVIYPRLDEYDQETKTIFARDIVKNNPYLREIILRDPLSAKALNKDYANIDKATESVTQMFEPSLSDGIIETYRKLENGKELPEWAKNSPYVLPAETEDATWSGSPGAAALDFGKGFVRGAKDIFGQGVKGYAALLNAVKPLGEVPDPYGINPYMDPETGSVTRSSLEAFKPTPLKDSLLYKFGQAIEDLGKDTLREGRPYPGQGFVSDLGSGAGSMAAGIGVASLPLVGPAAAGALFVGAGAGEAADRALAFGASPEQVQLAAQLGTIAGATNFVDVLIANKALGSVKAVNEFLKRVGLVPVGVALAEGGQEGLEQFVQNMIAKGVYNPDQSLMEDVAYNALIGGVLGGAVHGLQALADRQVQRSTQEIVRQIQEANLYLQEGKSIPVGLNPLFDRAIAQQAKIDVQRLDRALADAMQSESREKNPDLLEEIYRIQTNARIGINVDAVAALYGNETPYEGDGKLGLVSDITEQFQLAVETGSDIEIPLATWLAKVDPEVAKALREDIRVRPGSLTLKEAAAIDERYSAEGFESSSVRRKRPSSEQKPQVSVEELQQPKQGTDESAVRVRPADPVETVRKASGLEPLFAIGDRRLTMRPIDVFNYKTPLGNPESVNTFDLYDSSGRNVGIMDITVKEGGKVLWVENIARDWKLGPVANQFGPSVMRDLILQLKGRFPQAERVGGFRVSGARDKAGKQGEAWIKLDENAIEEAFKEGDSSWELASEENGLWYQVGSTEVLVKPSEAVTEREAELTKAVEEALLRVAGDKVTAVGGQRLRSGSREPLGAYIQFADAWPLILWAFEDPNALGTVRHEAIHHLRQYNFFKPEEWNILRQAALSERWIEKYNINQRYQNLSVEEKIEEAIADAFKDWWLNSAKIPQETQPMFERIKEFLQEIIEKAKGILGKKDLTWEDIFVKVESGEIASRGPGKSRVKGAFSEKMAERPFVNAAAFGNLEENYRRYLEAIQQRQKEDFERLLGQKQNEETRRQSAEWQNEEAALWPQVAQELKERPDFRAEAFFRDGLFMGTKLEGVAPKLAKEYLREDEISALPSDFVAKKGLHPDDAAALLGFRSGSEMISALAALTEKRRNTPGRPDNFFRKMVKDEVQRRLELKFGKLEENILEAAKEQALSESQINLLAEEMLFFAWAAGEEFEIDGKAIKAKAKEAFEKTLVDRVSSDKLLAAAEREYRNVETALLKNDPAAAFVASQRRYLAALAAKEAVAFEQAQAKYKKFVKRFRKSEVKGIHPDYLVYIQQLLLQKGERVSVTPQQISDTLAAKGNGTLPEFANYVYQTSGYEISVMPEIEDGTFDFIKDKMAVTQWYDYFDTLVSLAHAGREENLVKEGDERVELDKVVQEIVGNIETLPERSREKQGRWLYRFEAMLLRPENLLKDLDLRQAFGPLFRHVIVPLMQSKSQEFDLIKELNEKIEKIKGDFGKQWKKTLRDVIPQDIIYDPLYKRPMKLTREMLLNIMLNWGNRSNIEKFTRGYASLLLGRLATKEEAADFEAKVKALIDKHATEQDWKWVEAMWDIFKGWRPEIVRNHVNLTGVAPRLVEPTPVRTPFGVLEGGYWPVMYDQLSPSMMVLKAEKKTSTDSLFGPTYMSPSTSKGYLKKRTSYVDFVNISTSIEQAAAVMQQTIHDIAFRDSLMQARKILLDPRVYSAIVKHYGIEYAEQLLPWLQRIANKYPIDYSVSTFSKALEWMRVAIVSNALPLNLVVLATPDVGKVSPVVWGQYMANKAEWDKIAETHSKEIKHLVFNLDRDFSDALEYMTKNKFSHFQREAVKFGYMPVTKLSQFFRTATFVSEFQKAKAEGYSDHEAAQIADGYVRERHSGAHTVDLAPMLASKNAALRSLTMFYMYFNTMANWARTIPGHVRRGEYGEAFQVALASIILGAAQNAVLFSPPGEEEDWWKWLGRAVAGQTMSFVPLVRDVANFMFEGFETRSPLDTFMRTSQQAYKEIARLIEGDETKKPIKVAANVVGLGLRVPGAEIGRQGQSIADLWTGEKAPEGFWQWVNQIFHGTPNPRERK